MFAAMHGSDFMRAVGAVVLTAGGMAHEGGEMRRVWLLFRALGLGK